MARRELSLNAEFVRRACMCIVICAGCCPAGAYSHQPEIAASAGDAEPAARAQPEATSLRHRDVVLARIRIERAWAARRAGLSGTSVTEFNQRYDGASAKIAGGAPAEAIESIEQLRLDVLGDTRPRLGTALFVRADPPVLWPGLEAPPTVKLLSGAAPAIGTFVEFTISRADLAMEYSKRVPIRLEAGRSVDFSAPASRALALIAADGHAEPGRYEVRARIEGYAEEGETAIVAASGSLDDQRNSNAARLAALLPADERLRRAVRIGAARNALIRNLPDSEDSAGFLADLSVLPARVAAEIGVMEAGADPYRSVYGEELWRPIETESSNPRRMVVYAPRSTVGAPSPPLIVVLHGTGGDEYSFLRMHGAGRMKFLAERHGCIVASPAAEGFSVAAFDQIVEEMAYAYRIDPNRVYVLGHGTGGGIAWELARAGKVLRAACVGGGPMMPQSIEASMAPTLVIAGALDPIFPASRLRPEMENARRAGSNVEYREIEGFGHALLVAEALDQAVEWLMAGPGK